jgi:LacI family transcriptional regulator
MERSTVSDGRPVEHRPGARVGLREVADLAGVAPSSVSRVLSEHPDVSPSMRRRVLDAVDQLGYEPDFVAQSLRRGATLSVGMVIRDVTAPFMAEIFSGAEPVLRAAGYSMLLMNSGSDPGLDSTHIRFFQSRRVDGMILQLASDQSEETFETLGRTATPVVLIDRDAPDFVRASRVLTDHRVGMKAAVTDLLDLGHRRIALVSGALEVRPSRERLAGLRDAMRAAGIEAEPIVAAGRLTEEHGERATNELLSLAEPPTAIVVGSNQLLVGALRAFRARDIVPGAPISLVGCDDSALSELSQPPISVVNRDSREIGRIAADLLLARMISDEEPRTVTVSTTYLHRPSSAPPRS